MAEYPDPKWLFLIHQIPPKPAYLRVRIRRKLQSLGAVAIKNSVYVIPKNEQTLEDFQWVLKEIVQEGARAWICAASFLEGLTDEQVESLFRAACDADYGLIADEARSVLEGFPPTASMTDEDRAALETALTRLKKRFSVVTKVDFFKAVERETTAGLLDKIKTKLTETPKQSDIEEKAPRLSDLTSFRGRTWITRKGVYVDRMACAWLIRRFIDPDASFRFVSERSYRPKTGELKFDMYEGEFTHEGALCSFEVLLRKFAPHDQALAEIGGIIHDIDLKEAKFDKPEAAGIAALLDGIAASHKSDEARLERSSALFDDLYEYFRRK
jgi:hypothetical protein